MQLLEKLLGGLPREIARGLLTSLLEKLLGGLRRDIFMGIA